MSFRGSMIISPVLGFVGVLFWFSVVSDVENRGAEEVA